MNFIRANLDPHPVCSRVLFGPGCLDGMVFITDDCSFYYAHIWSKSDISICWRHLITIKSSSNLIFFSEKTYFKSYVRNMFWATILYRHHDELRPTCLVVDKPASALDELPGQLRGGPAPAQLQREPDMRPTPAHHTYSAVHYVFSFTTYLYCLLTIYMYIYM